MCVLMWPLGAPDGSTNYYKRLHPLDLSAPLPEMLEKEGGIKLQNSRFSLQKLFIYCVAGDAAECLTTHQHSHVSV